MEDPVDTVPKTKTSSYDTMCQTSEIHDEEMERLDARSTYSFFCKRHPAMAVFKVVKHTTLNQRSQSYKSCQGLIG